MSAVRIRPGSTMIVHLDQPEFVGSGIIFQSSTSSEYIDPAELAAVEGWPSWSTIRLHSVLAAERDELNDVDWHTDGTGRRWVDLVVGAVAE